MINKKRVIWAAAVSMASLVTAATYEDDFSSAAPNVGADPLTYALVSSVGTPTDLNWWVRSAAGNTWKVSSTNGNDGAWATKNNYSQAFSSAIFAVIRNDGSLTNKHYVSYDLQYTKGNVAMRVWGIDNSTTWSNSFKWSGGSGAFGPEQCLDYGGTASPSDDATPLLKQASRPGELVIDANWQRLSYEVDFSTNYDWIVVGFAQGCTSDGTEPNVGIDNFRISESPLLSPVKVTVVPGDTELNLSWSGDVSAETYNLYRSEVTGGPYTSLATALTTNTFTDTGLVNFSNYYYVVTSVSNAVESGYSPEGSGFPLPGDDVTPPDAPADLAASASSHWKVDLSWSANSEGDLSFTPYTLYRSAETGTNYVAIASNLTATTFTDTDVVENDVFFYVVTATDLIGNESAFSDEVSVTVPVNPNNGDILFGANVGYEDLDNNGPNGLANGAVYVFQVADTLSSNILYDVALGISGLKNGLNSAPREAGTGIGVNGNEIETNEVFILTVAGIYEKGTTGLANTGIKTVDQAISSNAVPVLGSLSLLGWEPVVAGQLTNTLADGTTFSWVGTDTKSGLKTVSFRVVASTATGFEIWSDSWLPAVIGSETNDFDEDGLNNLYEYGLGGNPTNGIVDGNIPTFGKNGSAMQYVYAQRTDDPSLVYYLETTGNLVFGPWENGGYSIVTTNVTGGTFDFVTNSVPTTADQTFVRLIIEN